ncbi:hypothetical protein [Phragmitibacter flavus]|uniref:hypothetical protein n=1 Tax=Phragmitibacter flavus TaxID=2576071 RepID=UPI0019805531|nr:hypothetical protein [Phragmitibacter flavus]
MILPPHEPDFFEKCVRFVCGFVLGAGVGLLVALRDFDASGLTLWLVVGGMAVVSGVVAVKYGDDFWRSVMKW